ncbi:MAG: O-methyltransferase [Candidatus Hydrogenedentota bacterium]
MQNDLFNAVDRYIEGLFVPADPVFEAALDAAHRGGLPEIQISPVQGKFLYLLAKLTGAKRILELGTLAGYSTIWLARALPAGGRLITLEYSEHHATVARANIARAGLAGCVEILTGPALDSLPKLAERSEAPFDLVFIDADKNNYPGYLDWVLRLVRPGGLILSDNVVRDGNVLNENSADESIQGIRTFNAALATHPRCESIILQQVGTKGYDGLAIARVRD